MKNYLSLALIGTLILSTIKPDVEVMKPFDPSQPGAEEVNFTVEKCYMNRKGKSILIPFKCCQYSKGVVPNGWFNVDTNDAGQATEVLSCDYGKLKREKISVTTPLRQFASIPKLTTFQQLEKLDKICIQIISMAKSYQKLAEFIWNKTKNKMYKWKKRSYEGIARRELNKVVRRYREDNYVCGFRNILRLPFSESFKKLFVRGLNREGFKFQYQPNKSITTMVVNKPLQHSEKEHSGEATDAKIDNRVVQGAASVSPGQFPWQVRFRFTTKYYTGICGGVLINNCYVLTARHCADEWKTSPQQDFIAILGDVRRIGIQSSEQRIGVHFVHFHPNSDYDIAILLLKRSPTTMSFIDPIRLSNSYPEQGERGIVSGWGRISSGSTVLPNFLRFREIDLQTFWWCHSYVQSRISNYQRSLKFDELCAGDETTSNYAGACHGDSGGPLVRRNPIDNQWELIGIVKRGVPNCPSNYRYGIYTSVVYGPIRWWINSILDKSSNVGSNGNCRCNARATKFDGSEQNAWWDGANCVLEPAPQGCGNGGYADKAGRQFVWNNNFYLFPHKGIECDSSASLFFDSCHCYHGGFPSGGNIGGTCINPSWGSGDSFSPVSTLNVPDEACAFKWSGNLYTTPVGIGGPAICRKGYFDGANCHYYNRMPVDGNAFLWPSNPNGYRNYYYGYPSQNNGATMRMIGAFPIIATMLSLTTNALFAYYF